MFDSKQVFNIKLADDMTVFELQTSGGRSDRSTNWATTTNLGYFDILT